MKNCKSIDKKYVANTYSRFDIEIVSGKGSYVFDDKGKKYIDLNSGIAVNTFGLCDKKWIDATTNQMNQFQHVSNLYYSAPGAKLAKMLCKRTGAKKVFFGNSGAEANECAIKVARKWAKDKFGEDDYYIITLKNSFHGRTITTLKATGQDVFHKDFGPFTEGFLYADPSNANELINLAKSKKCCAFMFEMIQGEGGVLPLDKNFVSKIVDYAHKNDILLIVDEVQTGNGRTGTLYAYEQYGFTPDIVTTAKGLAGGLPLGATLLFEKVEKTLGYGSHGSTFGANPVSCAGAISILSRINSKLLKSVNEKSKYIFDSLNGAKGIKSVSGMGLMIGIETDEDSSVVLKKCIENGVLPIKAKNKIRLLPALNIPMNTLKEAVKIIKKCAAGE